ncbi:GNAT family N-acetyltransferase [Nocardia gipuzkoensis]
MVRRLRHLSRRLHRARSGRLIGSAAIGVTSAQHRRGEFGFVFHRDFWSQGYATEVGMLLLRFGFDRLRLRRISATCHPDNHASARVLEKVGSTLEGRMRSHLFVRGVWRDSLLYAAVDGTT